MRYLVIVAAIYLIGLQTVTAFIVLLRRRLVLSCNKQIEKMYPHQLSGLAPIIDGMFKSENLWQDTHGFAGLWRRWYNSGCLVQLCQLQAFYDREISARELNYVSERAAELTRKSWKAALLGTVRLVARSASDQATLEALQLYVQICDHTHSIYSSGDALLCTQRLTSIL